MTLLFLPSLVHHTHPSTLSMAPRSQCGAIFTPYFTKKKSQKKTKLGTSIKFWSEILCNCFCWRLALLANILYMPAPREKCHGTGGREMREGISLAPDLIESSNCSERLKTSEQMWTCCSGGIGIGEKKTGGYTVTLTKRKGKGTDKKKPAFFWKIRSQGK